MEEVEIGNIYRDCLRRFARIDEGRVVLKKKVDKFYKNLWDLNNRIQETKKH